MHIRNPMETLPYITSLGHSPQRRTEHPIKEAIFSHITRLRKAFIPCIPMNMGKIESLFRMETAEKGKSYTLYRIRISISACVWKQSLFRQKAEYMTEGRCGMNSTETTICGFLLTVCWCWTSEAFTMPAEDTLIFPPGKLWWRYPKIIPRQQT